MQIFQSPVTDTQREAVREQLERISTHCLFRNSTRYPAFLKHVVEKSIAGQTCDLKERVIGHDLFGQPPGYDTNAVPIVRFCASETRKRLAMYYQDPEHQNELRIEMHPQSYVPAFRLPESNLESSQPALTASLSSRRCAFSEIAAIVSNAASMSAVVFLAFCFCPLMPHRGIERIAIFCTVLLASLLCLITWTRGTFVIHAIVRTASAICQTRTDKMRFRGLGTMRDGRQQRSDSAARTFAEFN